MCGVVQALLLWHVVVGAGWMWDGAIARVLPSQCAF